MAFLRTQLKQAEAIRSSKNRSVVTGNEQNTKRNRFLIGGGVAAALSTIPSFFKDIVNFKLIGEKAPEYGTPAKEFEQYKFNILLYSVVSKVIAIIGIGTFTYGVYLPHTDTESLETDAQLAEGTIEDLKTILVALQTKTPCPQEDECSQETSASPEEVPGVITEASEDPADKNEDQDFEDIED